MMSLEQFGFLEQPLERVMEAISRPYGALLVTGPRVRASPHPVRCHQQDHGPSWNLITVEDPVSTASRTLAGAGPQKAGSR
jgi:type II secretory ATPase GspE/PulE/Tfp pilus assembly ATPase PilB-like protein